MIEYKRKYSILHLTNEGLFHENQLPSDYDGPVLDIEVVHRIMFIDDVTGKLTTMTFNPPPAKSASRSITPYTPAEVKMRTAEVQEAHEDGKHYLPSAAKKLADMFITEIESDGKSKAI